MEEKNHCSQPHLILSSMLHNFLIDDLIHNLETLNGLLLCDSYISLFQRDRAETTQRKTCNIHKLIHKNIFSLQTRFGFATFFTCCQKRRVPWTGPHADRWPHPHS